MLLPEWAAFAEAVDACPDLDSLRDLHASFLGSVQRQCMARWARFLPRSLSLRMREAATDGSPHPAQTAPDPLWTLLSSRIRQILALAVDLGAASRRVRARGADGHVQAEWVRQPPPSYIPFFEPAYGARC